MELAVGGNIYFLILRRLQEIQELEKSIQNAAIGNLHCW